MVGAGYKRRQAAADCLPRMRLLLDTLYQPDYLYDEDLLLQVAHLASLDNMIRRSVYGRPLSQHVFGSDLSKKCTHNGAALAIMLLTEPQGVLLAHGLGL